MPRLSYRFGLLTLLLAVPAAALGAPDAAASQAPAQLFIAPSGEPFRAGPGEPYPVAAWFAAADTNHDGKLTESEFVINASRFFDTLDLDHDQKLGSEEIKRYENEIAPEVRSGSYSAIDWNAGGAPGQAGRPRRALGLMQIETDDLHAHVPEVWSRRGDSYAGSGASRYGIIAIPEPVMGMDTDLNGIVTQREMLAAAQRRFRTLDTENRNYLLLADLPETYVQSHAPKGRKR